MIPYNTDAPLYYPPLATVGLILLNTVLFFAVPSSLLELEHSPPQAAVGNDRGADDPAVPPDGEAERWGAGDFRIVDAEQPAAPVVDPAVDAPPAAASNALSDQKQAPRWNLSHLTLVLEYGVGLKPWQWLTSIFMHLDFFHLLFNMIALWAFGLVVEGKVGALVFVSIYLAIGTVQSGLEQTLMLFADGGGSMGASAAIFGILGIALVWAPRNDFDVFWSLGFHAGSIEVPILMYAFLVFALEGVYIALGRFGMSSGVLHLMGLALGIAVGYVWLRRQWVDCEGWDLINVWHGREASIEPDHQLDAQARELVRTSTNRRGQAANTSGGAHPDSPPAKANSAKANSARAQAVSHSASRRRKRSAAAESQARATATSLQGLKDVEQLITAGNIAVALKLLAKLKVGDGAVQLSQPALHSLVKELLAAQHFTAAIPFMREYSARFAEQRVPMQLNLAKLLLHLQQPRKAVEVLREMRQTPMAAHVQTAWQGLATHAQHQIDEGVVEVSDER